MSEGNTSVAMFSGGGLPSREKLAANLSRSASSIPATGEFQYLKMDRGNGEWVFGQEETVVEEDSLWAVNPLSFKHGYVCWDTDAGGAPIEEIMVSINQPLPDRAQLPTVPDGLDYQQQRSVELVCVDGEDAGTRCEYKQSSVGAMKLFGKLTDGVMNQLDKGDGTEIVPIVTLSNAPYKHKKYGRIFNPDWPVQDWRKLDDATAPEAAEKDNKPDKSSRKVAAKSESGDDDVDGETDAIAEEYEAAAAEEAAPRRRRRRS